LSTPGKFATDLSNTEVTSYRIISDDKISLFGQSMAEWIGK